MTLLVEEGDLWVTGNLKPGMAAVIERHKPRSTPAAGGSKNAFVFLIHRENGGGEFNHVHAEPLTEGANDYTRKREHSTSSNQAYECAGTPGAR